MRYLTNSKISKYKDVQDAVVSLMSSSLGYNEPTWSFLIKKKDIPFHENAFIFFNYSYIWKMWQKKLIQLSYQYTSRSEIRWSTRTSEETYSSHMTWRFNLFVCLFIVAWTIFQLSRDCHNYRWQTANEDLSAHEFQ
jgi:hypothetical protein